MIIMKKGVPKGPRKSSNTTGVAWNDSYAANKSAGNIRKMVTGSEANPFKAGMEDLEKFQYNPNRPLYDNRDEMGYGEWVEKDGDTFKRRYRYRTARPYDANDPTTWYGGRMGYQKFADGMIDPHTGEYHKGNKLGYNSSKFDQYFANYLNAMG